MEKNIFAEICDYCRSNSRNKIVFSSSPLDFADYADIGFLLSSALADESQNSMALTAMDALNDICRKNTFVHEKFGTYLAIKNICVLKEKELKIDLTRFLERESADKTLFVFEKAKYIQKELDALNGISILNINPDGF